MTLGNAGAGGPVWLACISRTWFWAADAHPPPLRPYPVLSVHVAYTDGNNFFQLLRQVGEACSRPCEGAFLSLSLSLALVLALLLFQPQGASPHSSHPSQLQFSTHASLRGWGLAFENPVFLCPRLMLPCIICPSLAV